MFLKRIEMQGFKSFADRVTIEFEHEITGVVGPNGCGKSNITDAVRWVLGEQSVKNLRGSSMSDVIFAGSADRNKVNMAEVTLVFDNSNHALNSDSDELEVTRRLYRDSGESEYLINRRNVRLKDILDLIVDTGLGKDSLSMISQGNVVSFADARPIDRRAIFEEAAGVAKYKKRKIETLSRLQRTKDNMDRCADIVNELSRQVGPLEKAAAKAKIYHEKKQRLQQIEVAVLVNEIGELQNALSNYKNQLEDLEAQYTMIKATVNLNDTAAYSTKKQVNDLDKSINSLQENLMHTLNDIQRLETSKIKMDEQRKYLIEQGTSEQKVAELRHSLSQSKLEYEDRAQRYVDLKNQQDLINTQLQQAASTFGEYTQHRFDLQAKINRLNARVAVLENNLRAPYAHQAGVQAIMDHQHALSGVLGVVGSLLQAHEGYENAISMALGGAINHIVTHDESSARNAIEFLKRNRSGRATFYPLTVCRAHYLNRDHEIIAENAKGYLGVAADFVSCDPKYDPVVESLLANVIVVDTLEHGNELARLLNFGYKIVDPDGDVIHRGGSMSGGSFKQNNSIFTAKKDLSDAKDQLNSAKASLDLLENQINDLSDKRHSLDASRMNLSIDLAQLEPIVAAKKAAYLRIQSELEQLDPSVDGKTISNDNDEHVNALINQLNSAYAKRDEISSEIKSKREQRIRLSAEAERKDAQNRASRTQIDELNSKINTIKVEMAKHSTKLDGDLNRLASEYALTYDYAKENVDLTIAADTNEEVVRLRRDIDALGNVNMNAPYEYERVNERYTTLKKQLDDLTIARNKILDAIDELDSVMETQFKSMFDAINTKLDGIFKQLFGGGKARLILEDPTDLLNTGIDIDVQPPGKSVRNIRLFSGGEKSLIALCVLFAILSVKSVPLVIFDEVEAALDQGNVERFAKFIAQFTHQTQFIVVTHRPGTMEQCQVLYGVTMQKQGVSQMLKVELKQAIDLANSDQQGG